MYYLSCLKNKILGQVPSLSLVSVLIMIIGGVVFFPVLVQAQNYDLLLKGGHVIDPKNHIDTKRDVAIKDGKIARVAVNIPASEAQKVVDVSGLYVTPGIIDIHVHVFWGYDPQSNYNGGYRAVQPDGFTFRAGVTTVVDAGSSGWRTFPTFKKRVIDHAKTRVLAFLNIDGHGMQPIYQQDTLDMSARLTAMRMRQYPNIIVGVKLAHFKGHNWMPAKTAEKASVLAGDKPIMVDFGSANPVLPLDSLFFDVMKPGDIFTHCYANLQRFNPLRGRESIVDKNYNLRSFVLKAQKRGIVFDVGHGGASFNFHTAINAIKQGLKPNSISSDMHITTINAGGKDMANLMSKFLNMGESLQEVILQSTWNPAKEIQHRELGNFDVGAPADVAVFRLLHGKFGFVGASPGGRLMGDEKLIAELTVRAGKVVWDLNGISHLPWQKMAKK